jgi:hypothetical protein
MLLRAFLSFGLVAFAAASVLVERHPSSGTTTYPVYEHRAHEHSHLHKRQNVSASALTEAQKIVEAAVIQQGE